ncbi:hypothetical protein Syun_018477 [Stephania yunnanensis]|uniref:DAGKc domain-containing protein n=1 Tax=Stephania yunnanensis TaxID=152371 RepID=A0AAP0ISZ8_9MAGN
MDGEASAMSSNLFLDHVGEVVLSINSDGLSWKSVDSINNFVDWGLIHESSLPDAGRCLLGRDSEMYRFTVHGYQRSKKQPSLWLLVAYTFGHKDLQMCQNWVEQINDLISKDAERPKSLLVFVHPLSGKRNGCKVWEDLAPIFSRAKVETKVTVTKRAGHALDVMTSITDQELYSYDGVVVVGGDGFFSEILNGLLCSRHKAPYPPAPENIHSVSIPVSDHSETELTTAHQGEDQHPLLQNSEAGTSGFLNFRSGDGSCEADQDRVFAFPNKRFRLGIIPAGSTDAIVICTTGTRDAITSALHIVLGKRVHLDIAQVVRWKMTASSKVEPLVRYAASFAGYGFYGDVISESEQYRWMGPKRYDYAGTKVFLKHRSYEAEINYIEVKTSAAETTPQESFRNNRLRKLWNPPKKPKTICRVNCSVCNEVGSTAQMLKNDARWLRSKGRFLSVGAAIISCRNERAPDGLVADAHLADGLLHLILIKDCPLALYLWHLTQLARKDGDPLDFKFVEHYKVRLFLYIPISFHKSVDTNWVSKLTSLPDLIQFYTILQMVFWSFRAEKMNTEGNEPRHSSLNAFQVAKNLYCYENELNDLKIAHSSKPSWQVFYTFISLLPFARREATYEDFANNGGFSISNVATILILVYVL